MVWRRKASRSAADPIALEVVPDDVPPPYRPAVDAALRARAQYRSLVAGLPDGPQRQRLLELAGRVDAGVLAIWQATRQAVRLEDVIGALQPERVSADLKEARRGVAAGRVDQATVDALTSRFTSMQRLLNALDDVRRHLPVLEARLETAVAQVAELTLTSPSSVTAVDALAGELDALVVDLDALRAGVAELG